MKPYQLDLDALQLKYLRLLTHKERSEAREAMLNVPCYSCTCRIALPFTPQAKRIAN